jgi:hypothetical protein
MLHFLENSLRKRLWTCRKADYVIMLNKKLPYYSQLMIKTLSRLEYIFVVMLLVP